MLLPKLNKFTRDQLVAEARRRRIFTHDHLKETPSKATKKQLRRAIRAHEKRKLIRCAALLSASTLTTSTAGYALGKRTRPATTAKAHSSKKTPPPPRIPTDPGSDPLLHRFFVERLSAQAKQRRDRRARFQASTSKRQR